jgi:uncharacterized protein YecE (DUF72 family)
VFYPKGLAAARELPYAAERLGALEINATFYGPQKPATFARWRDAVPADFVFSVKGPRFATYRSTLADGIATLERFLVGGVLELAPKLGPLLWQLPPTRSYKSEDMATFLASLPAERDGVKLRHVIEARHASFTAPEFAAALRGHGVAAALVESEKHPVIEQPGGDFAYLRLERSSAEHEAGYAPDALDAWAERLRAMAAERDVFAFVISGAKERNPAAAMALIERLR